LAAVVVWWLAARAEKVPLAVQAVVTVVLVAVLVKVAGSLHTDPRPFVTHPGVKPLFAHPADNGFPSDHTALATGVSALVTCYRRLVGAALLVLSALIGVARVLAHVHHWQDIGAGLLIGAVSAAVAVLLWRLVANRRATPSHAR
jgi:undecaprenyl-diphosphatase